MNDLIRQLDLTYLQERLIRKESWDQEDAQKAVKKYKNFLSLRFKYPEEILVPSNEIDSVWHAHILHTMEYHRDCEMIFGTYLHHVPAQGSPSEVEIQSMRNHALRTALLYFQEFQESYSLETDLAMFWGSKPILQAEDQ